MELLHSDGAASATLRVRGQIDGRSTFELRDAIEQRLRDHPGDVVLDLSGVEAVDLTALRMLAACSRAATLDGRWLLLRGCPPVVRRLLHLSHLRGLITFEEARPAAEPESLAV